ncbi:MAG: phage tail tape measure protein [Chloroflexi bacterium]|nr:phage tail tape measure protein [Chloroflexota bacterium]
MFNAIEVASLFATLELRDGNATARLSAFESGLDRLAGRLTQFGGQLQSAGTQIGLMVAPLVAFGAQGVSVAATFEQAMATISARTGLAGDSLEEIRTLALQMGADTSFSAQQAADAFLELLSSGQSAEEAIATLPAVLDAAAASGEDLGSAADDVTNILAAFRMPVTRARTVVNALSRAAGASSATMSDLGDAFANVGGVAAEFGLSVDETAAIFAVFAENGIKGSDAGTQLRSMLLNMARNTESVNDAWTALNSSLYDAQGNMRPLPQILGEIIQSSSQMTDEERIRAFTDLAGSYGILGMSALTTTDSLNPMFAAMEMSADAADVAAARMGTFAGATESLRGSIETLQIEALTPLMENTLTPLVGDLTDTVNRVTEWAKANPQLTSTIAKIVGIVALFAGGLVILGTVIGAAGTVLSAFGTVIGLVGGAIGLLTGSALLPLMGILLLVGGLVAAYTTNWMGFADTINWIGDEMRRAFTAAKQLWEILQLIVSRGPAYSAAQDYVDQNWSTGIDMSQTGVAGKRMSASKGSSVLGGSGTPFINKGTAFMGGGTALPMRAAGGPVMGGSPYIVGERGPELFVPGSSGSIVPNNRMGGVSIGNLTVQYNAMNGGQADYEGFVAFLERVAAG